MDILEKTQENCQRSNQAVVQFRRSAQKCDGVGVEGDDHPTVVDFGVVGRSSPLKAFLEEPCGPRVGPLSDLALPFLQVRLG